MWHTHKKLCWVLDQLRFVVSMNIGVIGVGYIWDTLVQGVFETEGSKIVSISDIVEAKASGKAKEWGVKAYFANYNALLLRGSMVIRSIGG